jgi:hypothetical protein
MPTQRWRARWREDGMEREYLFDSLPNLAIARIDFLLICADPRNALKVPDRFELEEVIHGKKPWGYQRASPFPPRFRSEEA